MQNITIPSSTVCAMSTRALAGIRNHLETRLNQLREEGLAVKEALACVRGELEERARRKEADGTSDDEGDDTDEGDDDEGER